MTPILALSLLLLLAIAVAVACAWIGREQELAGSLKDAKQVFADRPQFRAVEGQTKQYLQTDARPMQYPQRENWLVELATAIDKDEVFVDNLIENSRRRRGEIVVGIGRFS